VLRARKTEIVDDLRDVFSDAGVIVVTHYQGMSVAKVTELRRGMREAGAQFRVTKNRLAKIALADTPYTSIAELFTGPTAIAYSARCRAICCRSSRFGRSPSCRRSTSCVAG
jgi:large subunit ribosomal protein L10